MSVAPDQQPSTSQKIGIFGGSFNPPHISHVLACQFALSTWELDRILAIPSFSHPFQKKLESFDHRFRMAEIAFRHMAPWVEVSAVESELGGTSYTIDTVRHLTQRDPEAQFHIIIGSDIVAEANKWKEYDALQREAPFLIIPRLTLADADSHIEPGQAFLPAVSSTDIREALQQGRDPGMALPREVLAYIRKHQLYSAEH